MYKRGLFILIFLINIIAVFANYYDDWYFYNEWNDPIKNVEMIGWRCDPKDSNVCKNVDRTIPFTIQSMPVSSGNTNHIQVEYTAATSIPEYFIIYFYQPEYRINVKSGWQFDTYSGQPLEGWSFDEILTKKNNCQADFTYNIQSCAEAGIPLSILTDTELEADTRSAFTLEGITVYMPPELEDWTKVETNMLVNIKPKGSSSSVSNFPQTDSYLIPADESYPFSFLWQTSKNTPVGWYTVTMQSSVPDAKCDQSNDLLVTKNIDVYIAPSLDGCVAKMDGFSSPSEPDVGVPMKFSGTHVHSYQDWNYTTISACEVENAQLVDGDFFDVYYTLNIINRSNKVIATKTGTIPKKSSTLKTDLNTPVPFEISWTPTQYGSYEAQLTMTSIGSNTNICTADTKSVTASTTFTIGHDNDNDGYYCVGTCGDKAGEDCNDNDPDIYPGAPQLACDGRDYSCNGIIDEGCACKTGETKKCSDLFKGICGVGTAICEDGSWTGCPSPAEREICNDGLDNSCNGYIDCLDQQCEYYINEELNFYPCKSNATMLRCKDGYYDLDGNFSNGCEYKCTVTDGIEKCDGTDNNCDGIIDNVLEAYRPLCSKISSQDYSTSDDYFKRGICSEQKAVCVNGAWLCEDIRQEEICDGKDNNCDGIIDNVLEKNIPLCSQVSNEDYFKRGVCSEQKAVCSNGAWFCKDIRQDEICDGKDNNCDGQVDPGCECIIGEITNCSELYYGICAIGNATCVDGKWKGCPEPEEEICDGLDNNCDGQVDTGCECIIGEKIMCGKQQGVCEGSFKICTDGFIPVCDYTSISGYEVKEQTCDGLDNDCNGRVDELNRCCNPEVISERVCTCLNKKTQGLQKCTDYEWAECICPDHLEIKFPVNGRTYRTCFDDYSIVIEYDYDGIESCTYRLNTALARDVQKPFKAVIGENTLTLKCGNQENTIKFYVEKQRLEECEENFIELYKEIFQEEGYSAEDIEKGEETTKQIEQKFTSIYDETTGMTEIGISLNPKKNIGKAEYHLIIPKCLAEFIDEIEFDVKDFKVIKEDPIIAWEFAELDRPVNMNYRVKKRIPQDCLDQIQGMAIADLINYKEPKPLAVPIIILTIILIGFAVVKWLELEEKQHPHNINPNQNQDNTGKTFIESAEQPDQALEVFRQNELKKIKAMKLGSKDKVENYLNQMDYSEDMKKYIMKRI